MFSFKGSWGFKFWAAECMSTARIDGKTVVITGGNTGIGKETAIELAKRGGRVVICCRNAERAEKAVIDIKAASGSDNVDWYLLDLMSLQSVRDCASKILEKESRIDILINNAGIMLAPFSKTVDGIESHMATNHFGHFLFTILLLPKIRKSENARIINVTSIGYQAGRIDFDDLNSEKSYDSMQAYANSKLANVLFTRELAKKLEESNVRVYCLHPGLVDTELLRHIKTNIFIRYTCPLFMKIFTKDSRQGAQTSIHCAVSEEVAHDNGLYYSECKQEDYNDVVLSGNIGERFWDISMNIVGFHDNYNILSEQN